MENEKRENERKGLRVGWVHVTASTVAIAVLAVLLACSLGYIGLSQYQASQQQLQLSVFQQGQQSGAQQAIVYLFQQGAACQPIPLSVQNRTMTMIPVECLYQQAQSCQPIPVTVGGRTINMVPLECIYNRAVQCQPYPISFGNLTVNMVALECLQNRTG